MRPAVTVDKRKYLVHRTPRGAAVFVDENGRTRYVSGLTASHRKNNPHAFSSTAKKGRLKESWLKSLPQKATKRPSSRVNYRGSRSSRQIYDRELKSFREATAEEDARINGLESVLAGEEETLNRIYQQRESFRRQFSAAAVRSDFPTLVEMRRKMKEIEPEYQRQREQVNVTLNLLKADLGEDWYNRHINDVEVLREAERQRLEEIDQTLQERKEEETAACCRSYLQERPVIERRLMDLETKVARLLTSETQKTERKEGKEGKEGKEEKARERKEEKTEERKKEKTRERKEEATEERKEEKTRERKEEKTGERKKEKKEPKREEKTQEKKIVVPPRTKSKYELQQERKDRLARAVVEVRNLTSKGGVRIIARQKSLPAGATKGDIDAIKAEHPTLDVLDDAEHKLSTGVKGQTSASEQFYIQYAFPEQVRTLIAQRMCQPFTTPPRRASQPALIIMMYGSSGSGKTSTTRFLLRRLAHDILSCPQVDHICLWYLDISQNESGIPAVYSLLRNHATAAPRLKERVRFTHRVGDKNVEVPFFALTSEEKKVILSIREKTEQSSRPDFDQPSKWIETCTIVRTVEQVDEVDRYAQRLRIVRPTQANQHGNSQSHLFIGLIIVLKDGTQTAVNLIELAGSDDYSFYTLQDLRQEIGGNPTAFDLNQLQKESDKINQSLRSIPDIVRGASQTTKSYRDDERFERLLQYLISPNTSLTIIGAITPQEGPVLRDKAAGLDIGQYDRETVKTLNFLERMRQIKLGPAARSTRRCKRG